VPIGALVLRAPDAKGTPTPAAAPGGGPASSSAKKESVASRGREIEGIYVIAGKKAEFRTVTTGIRGELDVEVASGLKEGEEIVVGPFRALRDLTPGAQVVVDKTPGGGPQG
jgi:HlyD family secretion protein